MTDHPVSETEEAPEPVQDAKEWKDRYIRLAADYDNGQKRMRQSIDQEVSRARESMIRDWLDVVDAVERALSTGGDDGGAWAEGTRGVHRMMLSTLQRQGVEPIEADGVTFDPRQHEALGMVPFPDKVSGTVAHVQRTGYRDRKSGAVIRPAQVVVVR